MADRLTLSEALKSVAKMLESFPAGSLPPNEEDPEGYEPALAAALCSHPREIAQDCADPRLGVVQECLTRKALTAGRINDWCHRHGASLREFMERENEREWERQKAARAAREAQEASTDNLTPQERDAILEKFRARLGPNFGLKRMDKVDIARGIDPETEKQAEETRRKARAEKRKAFDERWMREEYAAHGLEPVRNRFGDLEPLSFIRLMNPALLRPAGSRLPPRDSSGNEDSSDAG